MGRQKKPTFQVGDVVHFSDTAETGVIIAVGRIRSNPRAPRRMLVWQPLMGRYTDPQIYEVPENRLRAAPRR